MKENNYKYGRECHQKRAKERIDQERHGIITKNSDGIPCIRQGAGYDNNREEFPINNNRGRHLKASLPSQKSIIQDNYDSFDCGFVRFRVEDDYAVILNMKSKTVYYLT